MAEIYGLYHPETGELRYIGKANDSAKRLKSHLRDVNRRMTPLYGWMRSLVKAGLVPCVRVLAVSDDWQAKEKELIAKHREEGFRLLNLADGGDEPLCSAETRKKNAIAINDKRAMDVVAYANHSYRRSVALLARHARKLGLVEAEAKFNKALENARAAIAADPVLFAYRLHRSKMLCTRLGLEYYEPTI